MDLSDRLAGAVWGHLVGDAVGVPYEFKTAAQITSVHFGASGTHHQPPGTWSDDGALMLATLASVLRAYHTGEPRFRTDDQAQLFLAWADDGAFTPNCEGRFDIGNATAAALRRLRDGVPAEKAGGTGDRDQGNGSLMRILPIALAGRWLSDRDLVQHAHRSSAITHAHPVPQATCALYVLVARNLLSGQARAAALSSAQHALQAVYASRPDGQPWLEALATINGWTGRSGRTYVVDSFWSAWDAVAVADDYRDAVVRGVRYGNDTDTTACIAGGLAGIRWGLGGIPAEWLVGMRGKNIVADSVHLLVGPVQGIPTRAASAPPGAMTSEDNPIRVAWIDDKEVPDLAARTTRLGMTFLPGKHDTGLGGKRHWRDLVIDVDCLKQEWRIDTFLLLVEDHELDMLGVPGIASVMAAVGIELIRFPITDSGTPDDPDAFRVLLVDVARRLRAGEDVVVACRGGLGRTGTVVACLLRDAGLDASAAIAVTRKSRPGAIENQRQEQFVADWAPTPLPPVSDLPFARYTRGGRVLLGRPGQGDLTARHGYGPPVFDECGYACVYCGLDMKHTYEGWLQISVDHVVPRNSVARGIAADWIEDITNLVTCCRTCNEFGNQFTVADAMPASVDAFFDLRDSVFATRKANIFARHATERAWYQARVANVFMDAGGSSEI